MYAGIQRMQTSSMNRIVNEHRNRFQRSRVPPAMSPPLLTKSEDGRRRAEEGRDCFRLPPPAFRLHRRAYVQQESGRDNLQGDLPELDGPEAVDLDADGQGGDDRAGRAVS